MRYVSDTWGHMSDFRAHTCPTPTCYRQLRKAAEYGWSAPNRIGSNWNRCQSTTVWLVRRTSGWVGACHTSQHKIPSPIRTAHRQSPIDLLAVRVTTGPRASIQPDARTQSTPPQPGWTAQPRLRPGLLYPCLQPQPCPTPVRNYFLTTML